MRLQTIFELEFWLVNGLKIKTWYIWISWNFIHENAASVFGFLCGKETETEFPLAGFSAYAGISLGSWFLVGLAHFVIGLQPDPRVELFGSNFSPDSVIVQSEDGGGIYSRPVSVQNRATTQSCKQETERSLNIWVIISHMQTTLQS